MPTLPSKNECCGCTACVFTCPKQCISFKQNEEGFCYPQIDLKKCCHCNKCMTVCPVLSPPISSKSPVFYACKNKNLPQRLSSSSGGIFTLLSENIIHKNGHVFGTRFNDSFEVIHSGSHTLEGCQLFKTSKYVESQLQSCYPQVKSLLLSKKPVLFSGTPCQIKGLRLFLKDDYPNLLCCDIICHGVPSPYVFSLYKDYLETKYQASITSINFRDKSSSWENFQLAVTFSNGQTLLSQYNKDLYARGFLKNLFLRPSCHQCNSKNLTSGSDITLGDFWGINKVLPDFNDHQGSSLVIIHSEKGARYFSEISSQLIFTQVSSEQGISHNSALIKSVKKHPNRKAFFEHINNLPIEVNLKNQL